MLRSYGLHGKTFLYTSIPKALLGTLPCSAKPLLRVGDMVFSASLHLSIHSHQYREYLVSRQPRGCRRCPIFLAACAQWISVPVSMMSCLSMTPQHELGLGQLEATLSTRTEEAPNAHTPASPWERYDGGDINRGQLSADVIYL